MKPSRSQIQATAAAKGFITWRGGLCADIGVSLASSPTITPKLPVKDRPKIMDKACAVPRLRGATTDGSADPYKAGLCPTPDNPVPDQSAVLTVRAIRQMGPRAE